MTNIERVAEAIRQHDDWWANGDQTAWECDCGWTGMDHAAHVAQAAIDALQLTVEHDDSDNWVRTSSRLVGPWVEDRPT